MRLQLKPQLMAGIVAILGGAFTAHAEEERSGEPRLVSHATARTSLYSDSDNVTVVSPVATATVSDPAAGWTASGHYLADIVSAASVDIVSTASQRWTEVRHAGGIGGGLERGPLGIRAQGSVSSEPDYLSLTGGGVGTWDLQKSHTLLLAYFHSHDTIGRTGTPFDVFSHTLDTDALSAGATLTLDRRTNLSIVSDVILERGDPSKPYRYIPIFSASVARSIEKGASIDTVNRERLPARPLEQLPLDHQRYAVTVRLGHRFDASTLRVDERLYTDSWGLRATTTEARYFVDLSRRFLLWPRLRVHAQTGTDFWQRAYVGRVDASGLWTLPRLRTGDRELGPLATVGAGAGASFGFGPARDPRMLTLVLQLDAMHTEFFDTLYVTARNSMLAALGVEGAFE